VAEKQQIPVKRSTRGKLKSEATGEEGKIHGGSFGEERTSLWKTEDYAPL